MDRTYRARLTTANADRVLRELTIQQHLNPNRTLASLTRIVCERQGFAEFIGSRALESLHLPSSQSAGRLSRSEICRLADELESAWQAELDDRVRAAELAPMV